MSQLNWVFVLYCIELYRTELNRTARNEKRCETQTEQLNGNLVISVHLSSQQFVHKLLHVSLQNAIHG